MLFQPTLVCAKRFKCLALAWRDSSAALLRVPRHSHWPCLSVTASHAVDRVLASHTFHCFHCPAGAELLKLDRAAAGGGVHTLLKAIHHTPCLHASTRGGTPRPSSPAPSRAHLCRQNTIPDGLGTKSRAPGASGNPALARRCTICRAATTAGVLANCFAQPTLPYDTLSRLNINLACRRNG